MMMTGNLIGDGGRSGGGGGGGGPCGACKFLRRKCVKGCVFAPYFDAEQGTSRFAAVHKVFGASNASKMLMRLPLNKRRDAVVTLCFEALARLHDPVYGSLGHLFSLQHQVMNLQAELAHVQARLSTIQHLPLNQPQASTTNLRWGSSLTDMVNNNNNNNSIELEPMSSNLDKVLEEEERLLLPQGVVEDGELQQLAMQFVSRYLPPVKHQPWSL